MVDRFNEVSLAQQTVTEDNGTHGTFMVSKGGDRAGREGVLRLCDNHDFTPATSRDRAPYAPFDIVTRLCTVSGVNDCSQRALMGCARLWRSLTSFILALLAASTAGGRTNIGASTGSIRT